MYDVIVIGGGASGMVAAIEASNRNKKVLLIEQNNKLGNKIYATGNGRCNLANSYIDDNSFRGDNPDFYNQVISCFGYSNTLDYFKELGLYTTTLNDTYIYPASKQASSVVRSLTKRIDHYRVEVLLESSVSSVVLEDDTYICTVNNETYTSRNVIISTGGISSLKSSDKMMAYEWAKKLGHSVIKPLPALVPLNATEPLNFNKVAGVRVSSNARLYIEDAEVYCEGGELQLTNTGLSGIMIFTMSRYAIKALDSKKKVHIVCDFSPDGCKLEDVIEVANNCRYYMNLIDVYEGFLDYKLAYEIIKIAGYTPESKASKYNKSDFEKIDSLIHSMAIPIVGYQDFTKSQVTCGGIDTREIDPDTMESKIHKGLYFTGEVLDVDGNCGGYNLMWAWATGYIAGTKVDTSDGAELIEQLKENPATFKKAYQLLEAYFHGFPIDTLRPLFHEDDINIRQIAMWITSELGRNAVSLKEEVALQLNDEDYYIRHCARDSIVCYAFSEYIDEIFSFLEHDHEKDRSLTMHLISGFSVETLTEAYMYFREDDTRNISHEKGLNLLININELIPSQILDGLYCDDALIRKYSIIAAEKLYKKYPYIINEAINHQDLDISKYSKNRMESNKKLKDMGTCRGENIKLEIYNNDEIIDTKEFDIYTWCDGGIEEIECNEIRKEKGITKIKGMLFDFGRLGSQWYDYYDSEGRLYKTEGLDMRKRK